MNSPVHSDQRTLVHPLLQKARGSLVDEDYAETERLLADAVDRAKDLEAEIERLRADNAKLREALQDVADKWPWVSAASDEEEAR